MEALEKDICGTIQHVSVGMLDGRKVKRLRIDGFDDSIVIESFKGDELFDCLDNGTDVYATIYVSDFDSGNAEWMVDTIEIM